MSHSMLRKLHTSIRRHTVGALGMAFILALLMSTAEAAVKPNPLFSDNAVLQQGKTVPVWGTAADGEEVTVKFQDQSVTTKAAGGKWRVDLKSLTAGGPFELTIAGENTITIKNVLVGEVWLASGQSNMQWSVKQSDEPEKNIAASTNPKLRLLTVPRVATDKPLDEITVGDEESFGWVECGPATVGDFSAVAYFFGQALQGKLGVPIGLINTSYGGTPAEAWTSREALDAAPVLKYLLTSPAASTSAAQRPTGLYNAMIHPLVPYAIQGAIWYQGESNAGRAWEYKTLFPTMIQNWRNDFGQGDFPFLFVQLAPFYKKVNEPGDSQWAELREAQRLTLTSTPNTAMAVITDVGDEDDIHPKKKAPVGARLALAAQALAYKQGVEYAGPTYGSVELKGNQAVVTFDHVGGGLVAAQGDKVIGFTIAGKDQKFHAAEARIEGNQVIVSSPEVTEPAAVRYGWANYPIINLANRDGLLASPFRTDDFPLTTQPKPAATQ